MALGFARVECSIRGSAHDVRVTETQLGSIFRAVRIHLGLRQEDVARRASVSTSSVSRIERGHLGRCRCESFER
jgi:DNA-binding XRE family transcriptional regulator